MSLRLPIALILALIVIPKSVLAGDHFLVGGGLNFSKFTTDGPDGVTFHSQDNRVGFNLLFGFQEELSPNRALICGIGFETRGTVFKAPPELGSSYDATISFNYIHLPAL